MKTLSTISIVFVLWMMYGWFIVGTTGWCIGLGILTAIAAWKVRGYYVKRKGYYEY